MKQLDRYSLMIISQYLSTFQDFKTLLMTCKKCLPLIEMFHYNPFYITLNQLKYFTHLETYYIYSLPIQQLPQNTSLPIVIVPEISYQTYKIVKENYSNPIHC